MLNCRIYRDFCDVGGPIPFGNQTARINGRDRGKAESSSVIAGDNIAFQNGALVENTQDCRHGTGAPALHRVRDRHVS